MPITIDELGLEKYLETTRSIHNDKGYAELLELLKFEVPKTKIAKAFNVTDTTIRDWLSRIKEPKHD